MTLHHSAAGVAGPRLYRTIWRWHFYAGLFCIPFVIFLAITGAIYLFKPQIESLIDRPYDHLTITGQPASPDAQVKAALGAVPGSSLHSYELPSTPASAARILVGDKGKEYRVYIHPQTLAVLKIVKEQDRLMRVIFHLHGELLMGDRGSAIVELAASWAIIMVLTGLYLWWPSKAGGLAGVVYPRLGGGRRVFWRDMHAVTGLWISGLVLLMLVSGLPWTKQWGSDLKSLRQLAGSANPTQDWTTGSSSETAKRMTMDSDQMGGMSMEHHGHGMSADTPILPAADAYSPLNRLVKTVAPLDLAPPVLISPPNKRSAQWTARSEAQNRPLRVNLVLDGQSGAILAREDFVQLPVIDRIVGIGVAWHEGQLFGWPNQLLGALTAAGLICVATSAVILWRRRKPAGVLGAPERLRNSGVSVGLACLIVALGIMLPMLGVSMIIVALSERFILRRIPSVRHWLGLGSWPAQA